MESRRRYIPVLAICISIILAAAIITYRPLMPQNDEEEFRFPVGIPPSLGAVASTWIGDEQMNAIYVSGSGSASAQANQATVIVGVVTEDPSAVEVVEDNAALMTSVIEAIKNLEIPMDKIKTVQYSVIPEYDWELRKTTGYRVTNMVKVEVDDVNLVGDVIDAAAEAGANNIQGITFGLTEDVAEELQREAFVLALQDARGKADLIAETLELEITGVLSVSESVYYPYTPLRGFAEAAFEGAPVPTPILEGALSVSVTVQVVYTFQ